jgi:hypothetical protein
MTSRRPAGCSNILGGRGGKKGGIEGGAKEVKQCAENTKTPPQTLKYSSLFWLKNSIKQHFFNKYLKQDMIQDVL